MFKIEIDLKSKKSNKVTTLLMLPNRDADLPGFWITFLYGTSEPRRNQNKMMAMMKIKWEIKKRERRFSFLHLNFNLVSHHRHNLIEPIILIIFLLHYHLRSSLLFQHHYLPCFTFFASYFLLLISLSFHPQHLLIYYF